MGDGILESLTCSICLELAEKAVETSCCHHIFCQDCLALVANNPCPQCRQTFVVQISHVSRRLIGNLPVKCEFDGCKDKLVKSELDAHMKRCQYRVLECPSNGCKFKGLKKEFVAHLAVEHEEILVQNAAKCFQHSEVGSQVQVQEDRVATRRNEAGKTCRLGSTGKFYCGFPLQVPSCSCCNGRCGPTNGCNCSACMKSDVIMQKLPKHWLVNREGAPSRRSPETHKFYCGRCVIQPSRTCDGYCGPTNGPNCYACHVLESQILNRYLNVWKD